MQVLMKPETIETAVVASQKQIKHRQVSPASPVTESGKWEQTTGSVVENGKVVDEASLPQEQRGNNIHLSRIRSPSPLRRKQNRLKLLKSKRRS